MLEITSLNRLCEKRCMHSTSVLTQRHTPPPPHVFVELPHTKLMCIQWHTQCFSSKRLMATGDVDIDNTYELADTIL